MRARALTNPWRPALAMIGVMMSAGELCAQSLFHVRPSLNVAVVSDSNLLARGVDQQADVISRTTPALDAEYRSRLLTVSGRYTFDADRFARNHSLTTLRARQFGALTVRYRARRLTLDGETSVTTTQTPGELNLLSGITLARGSARRVAVSPAITYQLNPLTKGSAKYEFAGDRLAGGVGVAFHAVSLTGERRVSRRGGTRVAYVFREFDFGLDPSSRSHTITVGWTRDLTQRATVAFGAGPRLGDGTVAADVSASMSYRTPGAEGSISYARAQTTLIGIAGAANVDSASASFLYGRPTSLRLRIQPAVMQTARAGLHARVYRLGLGASHPIGRRAIVEAAYDVALQRGDVYGSRIGENITRHLIVVSLSLIPAAGVSR